MEQNNKPKFQQINSLDELKTACDGVCTDFFIKLNFGARSSKNISYNREQDRFYIVNEIDGTEQRLNSKNIMNERYTNIGKAIQMGAFYKY